MSEAFKPVRGIFIIVMAVAAVVVLGTLLQPREVVPWRDSFAAARQEAQAAQKPVLAYFTASWCGPCQQMRRTTWTEQSVEAALADYVPVKIDIDHHRDLAMQYQVDGIPFFAVLDEQGQVVKEIVGYLSPDDFITWLRR